MRRVGLMMALLCCGGGIAFGEKGDGAPGGAAAAAQAWAKAWQGRNATQLRGLLATDATYSRLELVGSGKVRRAASGNIVAMLVQPDEVRVAKVRAINSQEAVGILTAVVDGGPIREWESWLTLRADGGGWRVAHIADIAMEGSYAGVDGCPETSAKRHESVTLYGKLEAGKDFMVRIFQTHRDTDAWAYASGKAKEKEKNCTPMPGMALEDLEVVVQEASGTLRGYQQFGRIDRTTGGGGRGISLYTKSSGGPLVAGGARLYNVGGGGDLFFLSRTWMSEKGTSAWQAVHRVDAYRWEGSGFRKVWGFDFGKEGGGLSGDTGSRVLWSMAAPGTDGTIHGTGSGACSGSINFSWSGNGFKSQKEGTSGGCVGSWWPGGESGVLSMGEVNLEKMAKKAEKAEKADDSE